MRFHVGVSSCGLWLPVSVFLMFYISGCQGVEYTSPFNYTNTSALVDVTCPSTQTIFTALTVMVLEGRSEFLEMEERLALNVEFQRIYNGLTESNCDAYFRRIANLTFIKMTNDLGDELMLPNATSATTGSTTDDGDSNQRLLQARPTDAPLDVNASRLGGGVDVTYEITGTCRACPVTRTGAFELYDDSFRRRQRHLVTLGDAQYNVRLETTLTTITSVTHRELGSEHTSNSDCQCVEGALPTEPRAPGVQECVDAMNVKFDNLREKRGLFQGLNMSDLLQLDDLAELDDDTNSSTVTDDVAEVARDGSKEPGGDGDDSSSTNHIWGKDGSNDVENKEQEQPPDTYASSSHSSGSLSTLQSTTTNLRVLLMLLSWMPLLALG
ncbi:expressed unknown protein [Seminavis robusta]|uniref:Uncharacterized protein n=1 Tax=Seminavis robusta TaxID=568900 RepID=A0A9N8DI54_9STRA|nr:expressed unknown protein [Seminavis robusta]|eukprot:Sro76_g041720.1 n/a (383) ;mRNA; f:95516-96763